MIKVANLNKSFAKNHVLRDISTQVAKGEVVVVIGPSGSGKSTFLRCLNLLEQPHAGRIQLNGEELRLVANRGGALKACLLYTSRCV